MIRKFLFRFSTIAAFFLLIQAGIRIVHFDKPSVDFQYIYYPNAVNFLNSGETYKLPNGDEFVSEGDITKHGNQPPGYSLLIATILKIGGGMDMIFWANALLLLGAIYYAWRTFRIITSNQNIIYIGLWALVLCPAYLFIPKTYNSEALFAFFTSIAVYFFAKALIKNSIRDFIYGSLLLIAGIETRSINIYIAPFILIPFLTGKYGLRNKLIYTGIAALSLILAIAMSDSGSDSYLRRTMSDGLSEKRFPHNEVAARLYQSLQTGPAEWKKEYINTSVELLKEKPLGYAGLMFSKSLRVWYATDSGDNEKLILVFQVLHLLAFFCALILFILRKLREPVVILFLMMTVYTVALATVNLSIVRYISPLAPFYIYITAYLCARFAGKWMTKNNPADSIS